MIDNKKYRVIGLMSGTSLDGIDLVYCHFTCFNNRWSFDLVHTKSIDYSEKWRNKLSNLFFHKEKLDLVELEYSNFISSQINLFINEFKIKVDYISSHGHTIFHQPKNRYTKQIGRGDIIANKTSLPVISNFREQDILLGGQGAPLVPFGDSLLFSSYDSCLNLGGFSNISYVKKGKLFAHDICPINIVFNELSNKIGHQFDKDGLSASRGRVNQDLLNHLNSIDYYSLLAPKSLSKEWIESVFNPVLDKYQISILDLLRTCSEHFVLQINNTLNCLNVSNCLLTGGGVFNKFFIKKLSLNADVNLIIPEREVIIFKEAIIFAFLGLLRAHDMINCLSSVTGASKDHSCGELFFPRL